MLVATVEPHFRHDGERKFRGIGSTQHRIEHHNPDPICLHCGKEIKRYGFSNDPAVIEGFYTTEYHAHMHFVCYDEIQQALALRLYNKEDRIVRDMNQSIILDQVTPYIHYNAMGQYDSSGKTSFKYCSYCQNQLDTTYQQGVSYHSSDDDARDIFGLQYIHTACYNYIRTKPRHNKKEEEDDDL